MVDIVAEKLSQSAPLVVRDSVEIIPRKHGREFRLNVAEDEENKDPREFITREDGEISI